MALNQYFITTTPATVNGNVNVSEVLEQKYVNDVTTVPMSYFKPKYASGK